MKKSFIYLFTIVALIYGCGSDNGGNDADLKNMVELDLSEHGYPLTIMIPDENTGGEASVILNDWNALEIRVGSNFAIRITTQEDEISVVKQDLIDHLLFTNKMIVEEPKSFIYEQYISNDPDSKHRFHFYHQADALGGPYEVTDLEEMDFNQASVETMLKSAKTIKNKSQESV